VSEDAALKQLGSGTCLQYTSEKADFVARYANAANSYVKLHLELVVKTQKLKNRDG
jgi:hypothetical protein